MDSVQLTDYNVLTTRWAERSKAEGVHFKLGNFLPRDADEKFNKDIFALFVKFNHNPVDLSLKRDSVTIIF